MTEQYIIGELSVRLVQLEAVAPTEESAVEFARLRLLDNALKPNMTPRQILAYWAENDSPSVYGRTGEDATVIARGLRQEAEQRAQRAG